MIKIDVKIKNQDENGWIFEVKVAEDNGKTVHFVELEKHDYERITRGKIEAEELVKKSFEFLLAREPKESILEEFNLTQISRCFSEYEKEIGE